MDASEADIAKVISKSFCDKVCDTLSPIRAAMSSSHMRKQMSQRLEYHAQRRYSQDVAFFSGDLVIVKNTQYQSKTRKRKFQVKDESLRQFQSSECEERCGRSGRPS